MVERCENVGFPLEALHPPFVAGKEPGKDLDGDVALELGIVGAVDLAHPAGAEEAQDPVSAEGLTGLELQGAVV